MAQASSSTPAAAPAPSPTILLFARGILAILDLWPALTIAVKEQWGGPDSPAKKTWLASILVDEFESRAVLLPNSNPPQIDPSTAGDPPLDLDDLGDLLNQVMSDEFDANIEDGSIDTVSNNIIRLWRDFLVPSNGLTPEGVVVALEERAKEVRGKGIKATRGDDPEEVDDSDDEESGSEEDEGMDVDEVPQLVKSEKPKERQEPIVDDDGFTLVQSGKRR